MKIICRYCKKEVELIKVLDTAEDNCYTADCDCLDKESLEDEYDRGYTDGAIDKMCCDNCEDICTNEKCLDRNYENNR